MKKLSRLLLAILTLVALCCSIGLIANASSASNNTCPSNAHIFDSDNPTNCLICGYVFIPSDEEVDDDSLDFTTNVSPDGSITIGDYTVIINDDSVNILKCNNQTDTIINIPSTLGGFKVSSLNTGAFTGLSHLTDILIPNSVKYISDNTFTGCINLKNVWYKGSVAEKAELSIGYENTELTRAKWYYGTCSSKHTYQSECDTQCNECQWIRSSDTPHIWSEEFRKNDSTHWIACSICETAKPSPAKHDYTNTCDTSCNTCGYVRSITHSWGKNYNHTVDKHWPICTVCGVNSSEKVAHDFDNSCDKSCNTCGYERNVTHNWNDKYTYNSTSHWQTCSKCVNTTNSAIKNLGSHTYKTTTTKADLSKNGSTVTACSVCGRKSSTTVIKYVKTFTLSNTSYTYDGKVKTPTVTVKDSAGNKLKEGTDYTVSYASGRKNVGTYNVTVTMKGKYSGTKTLTFKINPIDISKCDVKLSSTSYTYNGSVKKPSVTVQTSSGTKLTKDTHYTVTYASGRKNVGTYNVTIKGKGNYTGTKILKFKINPIDISKCSLKLSATSYTYNGSVKTPAVTVKNASGTTLKKDTHYTVTYTSGRRNAGTYKVTVTMKGNYTGTKVLTFKINPIDISKCDIKLSGTSYTYNGNAKKPTVTIKSPSGSLLTNGSNYTVTYASGCKNVGTYKITIKMKGNYTGTKTLTFQIIPPATTISKLTAGSKSFTVGITKKSTQVTGYQVQYSTSNKFSGATTKTISSYNTTSYTIKSLSAKKTYYVRVRTYKTVNGTKHYSGWSATKYVITK